MIQRRSLGQLARDPLYNTRAVVQTTTVPADTFRAWERRYGLPRPYRTSGNQRLYSERDIGLITWLRDRTDEGMTISQAIQRLKLEHPDIFDDPPAPEPAPADRTPASDPQLVRLRQRLLDAIVAFDDVAGERALDEALALFSLEEFCARMLEPTLHEIGVRWSRNELSVSAEHFATRLITRRLSTIFNMVSPAIGRGTIVAACAPGEEHEVGLLILAIFLARRNWRVIYLGANVPARDLAQTVRRVQPDLVCLSAATTAAAENAIDAGQELLASVQPPPLVAIGGHAFATHASLRVDVGVHYLTGSAHEITDQIAGLIERDRRERAPGGRR